MCSTTELSLRCSGFAPAEQVRGDYRGSFAGMQDFFSGMPQKGEKRSVAEERGGLGSPELDVEGVLRVVEVSVPLVLGVEGALLW